MYIKSSNDKYYVFYNKNKHIGNILIKNLMKEIFIDFYTEYILLNQKRVLKKYII